MRWSNEHRWVHRSPVWLWRISFNALRTSQWAIIDHAFGYDNLTFVIIECGSLKTFKSALSSFYPDMQFNMKEETVQELPFLRVLIQKHCDVELSISVNRKDINMDCILNFEMAETKHILTALTHTPAVLNQRGTTNGFQNNRYAKTCIRRYTQTAPRDYPSPSWFSRYIAKGWHMNRHRRYLDCLWNQRHPGGILEIRSSDPTQLKGCHAHNKGKTKKRV